ncbi:MAG: glycosyltransferase family 2 protein [Sciscionella sp.]
MDDHFVDVVLPCLNEEGALAGVLGKLPQGYRAIVVDNGSTDDSVALAQRLGAKVVFQDSRGYGAAVHTGLEYASSDIVCFCDADGSLDLGCLPELVRIVRTSGADMAVGKRVPAARGVWPWHARAGNCVLAFILRRKGIPVTDIAPIRAVDRARLVELRVLDRAFGYPLELLLKAAAAGWTVLERPVPYYCRAVGTRSKVSGSVRGTARAIKDMAKVLR